MLETYADGQRRLIPVSFFYERHYYDAGLYRATPVPFTLSSETVYEVRAVWQAAGDVYGAERDARAQPERGGVVRQRTLPGGSGPGDAGEEEGAAQLVVVEDSTRPVLHRREGSEGDRPAAHGCGKCDGGEARCAEADDDPDRPSCTGEARLGRRRGGRRRRRQPDSCAAHAQRIADPTAKHAARGRPRPVTAGEAELTADEDADHPILRRGKPTEEQGGARSAGVQCGAGAGGESGERRDGRAGSGADGAAGCGERRGTVGAAGCDLCVPPGAAPADGGPGARSWREDELRKDGFDARACAAGGGEGCGCGDG